MSKFLKKSYPFFILIVLAFVIHLAFLSYPAQVVFDEVHFGKFVSAYFTGQYYFDIHPPLGKLLIAGWAKLNGFNQIFDFDHIGQQASPQLFFTLRFLPAFFGALFVLLFAWFGYLIGRSKKVALLAGFFILLDSAFLVQSRFILVDIFMLFFEILALCFFFLQQRQKIYGKKWFFYLIAASISFGLTISVKWTGLATVGIIATVLLAKIFSEKLRDYLGAAAAPRAPKNNLKESAKEILASLGVILAIGLAVYMIPFAVHFKLLPRSGPGDAFMSQNWQKELKYGRERASHPLTFLQKFVELNKTMYTASAGITASHPYSSRWYAWPFGHKPIYYWNDAQTADKNRIYFSGNPALWYLALGTILIISAAFFTKKRNKIQPIFYILILAYLANLLPFILISRVSFLYHYLPSAMYGVLITALLLSELWPRQKKFFIIVFAFVAAGFLFLIPVSYGIAVPEFLSRGASKIIYILAS